MHVVLCSITPCNHEYSVLSNPKTKGAHIIAVNNMVREYAASKGFTYCDYHPALVAADGLSMQERFWLYNDLHPNPDAYTIESSTIVLGAPTKEGFVFNGWFYDKKFTDRATQISRGSTGDITLYAKWELVTYEVTYMAGRYGSGIIAPDLKEHGFEMNLSKKTYERKGYIQTGWSKTDGGVLAYKLGATYDKDEPLALFPYWEEEPDAIRPVAKASLDFSAVAHGRTLEIYGVPAGKVLSVFDMQGRLVSRATATGASLQLDIAKPGIYLVRAGSQSTKVNIR